MIDAFDMVTPKTTSDPVYQTLITVRKTTACPPVFLINRPLTLTTKLIQNNVMRY